MERHGARKKHRAVPDHTTTPDPATWPDETIPPLVLTFKVHASNGLLLSKTIHFDAGHGANRQLP
jgi:hypothetical protein